MKGAVSERRGCDGGWGSGTRPRANALRNSGSCPTPSPSAGAGGSRRKAVERDLVDPHVGPRSPDVPAVLQRSTASPPPKCGPYQRPPKDRPPL